MPDKHYGLVLTRPGAPDSFHTIIPDEGPPIPGTFHPSIPTPVGGEGDPISLEQARKYDKDKGIDLELVEIGPRQAKAAAAEQPSQQAAEAAETKEG